MEEIRAPGVGRSGRGREVLVAYPHAFIATSSSITMSCSPLLSCLTSSGNLVMKCCTSSPSRSFASQLPAASGEKVIGAKRTIFCFLRFTFKLHTFIAPRRKLALKARRPLHIGGPQKCRSSRRQAGHCAQADHQLPHAGVGRAKMSKSSFKRRIPGAQPPLPTPLSATDSGAAGGASGLAASSGLPATGTPVQDDSGASSSLAGSAQDQSSHSPTSTRAQSLTALPAGLRSSSSSGTAGAAGSSSSGSGAQPPLFSTGIAALDDILSGSGLSSSSTFVLIPTIGTNALPPCTSSAREGLDGLALCAAEAYTELVLKYGVAQGLHAGHEQIVIGEGVDAWTRDIMRRVGEEEEDDANAEREALAKLSLDQEQSGSASSSMDSSEKARLKIAFRYDKLPRLASPFDASSSSLSSLSAEKQAKQKEEARFCAQFDLNKSVLSRILENARNAGRLRCVNLCEPFSSSGEADSDTFSSVLDVIRAKCEELRAQASEGAALKALRISLRSFGSEAWWQTPRTRLKSRRGDASSNPLPSMAKFLLQLRSILRSFAYPVTSPGATTSPIPVPIIATISLSASFLASLPSRAGGTNHLNRLLHLSDAAISLSSFAVSPLYTAAFEGYTGSIKVIKTPAIGTLSDISVRASILRGMSSLAAGAGAGKAGADTAGGGAGGGENNLAFKVKRKRMVIETLNLNVDAVDANEKKGGEAAGSEALQSAPRVSPQTVHKPTQVSEPSSQSKPPPASEAHLTPAPRQSGSLSSPVAAPAKPAFSGLKSLRERGMQMKKGPASGPSATAPDHLEIDGSTSEEPQGQQRKAKHIPPRLHAGGDLQNLDF